MSKSYRIGLLVTFSCRNCKNWDRVKRTRSARRVEVLHEVISSLFCLFYVGALTSYSLGEIVYTSFAEKTHRSKGEHSVLVSKKRWWQRSSTIVLIRNGLINPFKLDLNLIEMLELWFACSHSRVKNTRMRECSKSGGFERSLSSTLLFKKYEVKSRCSSTLAKKRKSSEIRVYPMLCWHRLDTVLLNAFLVLFRL